MSLKTAKLLQTIAVCLFALALICVLLCIKLWPKAVNIFYGEVITQGNWAEYAQYKPIPVVGIVTAAVYLFASLIQFIVLKKGRCRWHFLASLIACALIIYCFDSVLVIKLAESENMRLSTTVDSLQDGLGRQMAQIYMDVTVNRMLPFITIPAKILSFVSVGAALAKTDKASQQSLSEEDCVNRDPEPIQHSKEPRRYRAMSLKTCKLLQTVAVGLFVLALVFVLLSIPLKNKLIEMAYPNAYSPEEGRAIYEAGVVPVISLIAVTILLGISLIHLVVLKKYPQNKPILISVITCAALFTVFKVCGSFMDTSIANNVMARYSENAYGYSMAYAMLENTVNGLLPIVTVPASVLMFIALGGSIGKGENTEAVQAEMSNEAMPDAEAKAEEIAPRETVYSKPEVGVSNKLKELAESKPLTGGGYESFKRPENRESANAQIEADPDYLSAFKRPTDRE